MTQREINEFIRQMELIGDHWEAADVKRVYGHMSLQDALEDRKASLGAYFDIIGKVINR